MTGALDGDIAGAAFGVGASCLQKPLTRLQLLTFLAGETDFARRLEQELERWRILDDEHTGRSWFCRRNWIERGILFWRYAWRRQHAGHC